MRAKTEIPCQGNRLKPEKPCLEMFATSASKVAVPSFSDFIFSLPNEIQDLSDFVVRNAEIGRQLDLGSIQNFASP